jgi:hypothetical protein
MKTHHPRNTSPAPISTPIPSLQLPQPEENAPAPGGEWVELFGAAHRRRAHHIQPVGRGQIGTIGLQHPAGDASQELMKTHQMATVGYPGGNQRLEDAVTVA